MFPNLLSALNRDECLLRIIRWNALMHINTLKVTIWINNTGYNIVPLINKPRFIRTNTVLVRLWIYTFVLLLIHLIFFFNCDLRTSNFSWWIYRIVLAELWWTLLSIAIYHRLLFFTNKRIVFVWTRLSLFSDWKFTWFLITWGV